MKKNKCEQCGEMVEELELDLYNHQMICGECEQLNWRGDYDK